MKSTGAVRTQREVARIMTERGMPLSKSRVFQLEQRALQKLRRGLVDIAVDMGVVDPKESEHA